MASYTAVIKCFFKSCVASRVAMERQQHREFSVRVLQSRYTIYWLVKHFEETGTVCDKRSRGRNCSSSVRKRLLMQHGSQ